MSYQDSTSPHSHSQLVSIGRAAFEMGVSRQSLRSWEKSGQIGRALRTPGGGRRFCLRSLRKSLGVEEDSNKDSSTERRPSWYARVSSETQSKAGSLLRQQERLTEFVLEKEGVNKEAILEYSDVASSFGDRPSLNKCISDVIAGKISVIYIQHISRLSRVPSLTKLVEYICRQNNVRIVAIDVDETRDIVEENMRELLDFVHVISCRLNAQRNGDRAKRRFSPEVLEKVRIWKKAGHSISGIVRLATQDNLRTTGDHPLSYHTIRLHLIGDAAAVADVAMPLEVSHSFADFAKVHLRKNKGGRVKAGAIRDAYLAYCKEQGIDKPISRFFCGRFLRREMKLSFDKKGDGYTSYTGISLKG